MDRTPQASQLEVLVTGARVQGGGAHSSGETRDPAITPEAGEVLQTPATIAGLACTVVLQLAGPDLQQEVRLTSWLPGTNLQPCLTAQSGPVLACPLLTI